MSIKRWFDLQDQGAKLDRKVGSNGSGYLELSFRDQGAMTKRVSDDRVRQIANAGWVKPDAGAAIRNYGDFRDFTEIARALSAVFDEETIRQAIAPRDELRQGEVLEGVDRPIYVGKEHIDQSLKFLPDTLRARATDMISAARERQERFRGAKLGATGGRLFELAEQVSEHSGTSFASSIAKLASARYDDETLAQIEQLIANPTDSARDQLEDVLRRIDLDEGIIREARKEGLLLGRSPELAEQGAAEAYLSGQPDARDISLDLDRPFAAPAPLSDGFKRDVHGFKFEVSADTTTLAAREYQARLTRAVEFIAGTFGMEPAEVFEPNTRIRVVQGLADRHTRGQHVQTTVTMRSAESGEDDLIDSAGAIVFSQATMGTALHEMCHALSRRMGDDPQKYDEIVLGSGMMDAFDGVLAEGRLNLRAFTEDPEFVGYLRDPEEVLARVLENAIRHRCLEEHGSLEPLGGHAVAGWHENYAPVEPKVMERALQVVRAYGSERGVMTQLGGDAPEEKAPEQAPEARVQKARMAGMGR